MRRARPTATVGAAGEVGAGVGVAGPDHLGLRRRGVEQAGGRRLADPGADGRQVAGPVRGPAAGGPGRRAPAGPAAVDPAGQGRRGDHRHAGGDTERCHALVEDLDGAAGRPVALDDRADLAPVRPQTASAGRVQALHRPAVRGQSRRCRRPLPQSAGEGGGAVRGREDARCRRWTAPSRCCR